MYRFFKIKYTFRDNIVWNLVKNFHGKRLIIQGKSMLLTFWLIFTDGCRANAMLRPLRGMRRFNKTLFFNQNLLWAIDQLMPRIKTISAFILHIIIDMFTYIQSCFSKYTCNVYLNRYFFLKLHWELDIFKYLPLLFHILVQILFKNRFSY